MVFNNPIFLYGLFALVIPILIHLFNFRRYKRMMFSNIEYLKNITVKTQKQNELRQLLILLTRLLALAAIIIAFADPQWKNADVLNQSKLAQIYVDNSFSMMADGDDGRLFDQASNMARNIVLAFPDDEQFVLMGNETGSRARKISRETAISGVDRLSISPATRNISSVVRAMKKISGENGRAGSRAYLISDFQSDDFDPANFPEDSLTDYFFIPVRHINQRNVYIDSCWIDQPFLLPGKPVELNVRVANASDNALEKIPLKLTVNGIQKAAAGVDLAAGDKRTVKITLFPDKPGWNYGYLWLEDYPVTFDDSYYFAFEVRSRIPVLVIHGDDPGRTLTEFYRADSTFDLTLTGYRKVNYNLLDRYALIILNSLPGYSSGLIAQIRTYLENGGNVLFIPDANGNMSEENMFLRAAGSGRIAGADTSETRVVKIKASHDLFRDIITDIPKNADLPEVRWHVRYEYGISTGVESLATLLNGDDFLLTRQVEQGHLFLLAVPLNAAAGNFALHPLFVPVMYGAALQGEPQKGLAYTVGKDIALETRQIPGAGNDEPFNLVRKNDGYTFIPEQMMIGGKFLMNTHEGITGDGFYDLQRKDSVYHVFAYNYDRRESAQQFAGPEEIGAALEAGGLRHYSVIGSGLETSAEVAGIVQKEATVWKLFIIFALFMLLAEVLILRLWK